MFNLLSRHRTVPIPERLEPQLSEWMQSALGQVLIDLEKEQLAPVLSRVFGYHILQLSCAPEVSMVDDCPAGHKICFAPSWTTGRQQPVADIEALPLATDSVDAVLLHHALDFTPDSHRLLREATRVLIPGGRLLIVGFNPASLWGLSSALQWRPQTPWNARFISRRRLTDWLSLLDFHVEKVSYGGFLPPLKNRRMLAYAARIEAWLDRLGNPTGAFYVIVASKQRVPLIPVAPRWKGLRAPGIGAPLAETGRVASGRGTVVQLPIRNKNINIDHEDKT
jgi:SAM-dependent methyltransferase